MQSEYSPNTIHKNKVEQTKLQTRRKIRMGENICKWSNKQGANLQNMQTTQYKKIKIKKKNTPLVLVLQTTKVPGKILFVFPPPVKNVTKYMTTPFCPKLCEVKMQYYLWLSCDLMVCSCKFQ